MMPGDEELGKKDDDHKPGAAPRIPVWTFARTPLRWRRRRILLVVVGLYLVYLFVHNIPDMGEFHGRNRITLGRTSVPGADEGPAYDEEPKGPPRGASKPKHGEPIPQIYAGQIRFYRLAASLTAASYTHGYRETNKNVLFAMSSLKSATALLPMVCEMARWQRNFVHAAFVGREDIPIADLLDINGIDKTKCPAIWHDARPDYVEWSTEARLESSVASALTHIHSYLHPQVVIMDDSISEDAWFVRALRSKTKVLEPPIPVIEVPKGRSETFMWISRLDAGSLKNWHKPSIDILIQVPPDSSGGIIRLLKSIRGADYSGLKMPRITIELPPDLDGGVKQYLQGFVWPPDANNNPLSNSQLTIRRRIASPRATQEDSAIRFLELYFPSNPANSHMLLLSPQAELSPLYFQYLKYLVLEFKYSAYGEEDAAGLMGASLELPSVLLDGKSKLALPKVDDMHTLRYTKEYPSTPSAPFLWQAPNSHAALFFGDKWAELHSFLNHRVTKQHMSNKPPARAKQVSETLPSWTEYVLELMRARGYSLYYPSMATKNAMVTIHNELYHIPEEFAQHTPPVSDAEAHEAEPINEPFLKAEEPPAPPKNAEPNVIPKSQPLHVALPFEGDIPEIPHLPYLLYNGKMIPPHNVSRAANEFAAEFRETVGGCTIPKGKRRVVVPGSAKDLFCLGDEDEEDYEDDVKDSDVVDAAVSVFDSSPEATLDAASTRVGGTATVTDTATATVKYTATATAKETKTGE
ncbi:hypothetical protein EJ04DRAFT_513061 [Polyplosphaeria fusca]|uniref:Glycosyltransferase 2 n=1 Tax=Polyplosphaeria fusca TaxID=682080 RepID=A0A9P4QY80_9PLEO|nr:hypothetical protein EJ04DRAFT_513061 [Polyplosphaeria fusca]